ncbi:MAG: phosphatase [Kangiella sp.]|nr:MAG: phosphatase [Kangiella sp.]
MSRINKFLFAISLSLFSLVSLADDLIDYSKLDSKFKNLTNFHFVSKDLASSGYLKMEEYQLIKQYGFKHVINLIPGDQKEEKHIVESHGLSYEQIQVDWSEPSLENFETFSKLMKSYGKEKVYVHCQANYRASTFVFLHRVLNLGIEKDTAKKDLLKIWTPNTTWQDFIDKVLF